MATDWYVTFYDLDGSVRTNALVFRGDPPLTFRRITTLDVLYQIKTYELISASVINSCAAYAETGVEDVLKI